MRIYKSTLPELSQPLQKIVDKMYHKIFERAPCKSWQILHTTRLAGCLPSTEICKKIILEELVLFAKHDGSEQFSKFVSSDSCDAVPMRFLRSRNQHQFVGFMNGDLGRGSNLNIPGWMFGFVSRSMVSKVNLCCFPYTL